MATQTVRATDTPIDEGLARFRERVSRELLTHAIIEHNPFTSWFSRGEFSREQLRQFIVQFSVFSNLFLVAQLLKTVNAPTLEAMRASKEILANEIGVVFARPKRAGESDAAAHAKDDAEWDPEIVSPTGTVEGGTFRHRAAHFEWLLRIAEALDLRFEDIGKRRHGRPSTLFFCDELARLYGSADPVVAEGASFAVEHWAAAGFWKELIQGLERYKARTGETFSVAFFTWHDRLEDQHAGHTDDELAEAFGRPDFDEERFIAAGREMLDGVRAFWVGLDEMRRDTA
jgi:pyrroloquinoline quinone (PQQ) biosynthesis protein C